MTKKIWAKNKTKQNEIFEMRLILRIRTTKQVLLWNLLIIIIYSLLWTMHLNWILTFHSLNLNKPTNNRRFYKAIAKIYTLYILLRQFVCNVRRSMLTAQCCLLIFNTFMQLCMWIVYMIGAYSLHNPKWSVNKT